MALLTYNGISLPYSTVLNFRNEAVPDEVSRTDFILTRYDIRVECLIMAEAIDMVAPDLEFDVRDPATIIFSIEKKLMQYRRSLSFKFNDVEFIPQPNGVAGTVDSMNGPVPQSFTYVRLTNTTWVCQFHVIAHYRLNPTVTVAGSTVTNENLPGNVILYNRWDEKVSIDANQYTRKVRSGKFMIRSDNLQGMLADQARSQMAVVGVPVGCVRESAEYGISPDGLSISYTILDREVYRLPPPPATQAQGTYTEEATLGDGKRLGHVSVQFKAPKSASQMELCRVAVSVAIAKLGANGSDFLNPDPEERGIVQGATLTVGMYENTVAVRISVLYPTKRKKVKGVAFLRPSVVQVKGSGGTGPQPKYRDRGTAGFLLQAARYYDPDITAAVALQSDGKELSADNPLTPTGKNQMPSGLRPGEAGKTKEA